MERDEVTRSWRRLAALPLFSLASVAVLLLTYFFFVTTERGQALDQSSYAGVVVTSSIDASARALLSLTSNLTLGLVVVALVVTALLRRRPRSAAAAFLLVGAANVTTQVLKELLHRPEIVTGGSNSFPSGHTTVAASVAVAALLVAPRSARPLLAVLGALFTALTGFSTLVAGWHRPSDVIAALAVTGAVAGLALLVAPEHPRASRVEHRTAVALLLASVLATLVAVAIGVLLDRSGDHALAYAAAVAGTLAGSLALSGSVLRLR